MFVAGYGHFLRTAASLQWDEAAVDLRPDAAIWSQLDSALRGRVLRLVAGFCVAEAAVASEIAPFSLAAHDADAAACFEVQAIDEERHARFFDRVAAEVAGVPGASRSQRRMALRPLLDDEFVELFEARLPAMAGALARNAPPSSLAAAVSLYHLLLEGVVFAAGQLTLVRLLESRGTLPGLRCGVELVVRDERWHIGLGARLLDDLAASAAGTVERIVGEAEAALAAWGDAIDPDVAGRVLDLNRRRLSAARLAETAVPA